MESETPFLEGAAGAAFALLQNLPSSPAQLEHSDLCFLGMQSFRGRIQSLGPRVSSSSLLPLVVSVLPISSAFPFRSFDHFNQMDHPMNHPSDLGPIRQDEGLIESLESKALNRHSLVFGSSDHTPFPPDRNRLLLVDRFSSLCFFHASFPKPPQQP